MAELPANSPELLAGDVDFYCAACGYNLRGLAGDPKRCPECGHRNPISDLVVPAGVIRLQLRRLETAPTFCFGGVLMAAFGVALLFVDSLTGFKQGFVPCWASVLPLSLVWWAAFAYWFGRSCEFSPGWAAALRKFHLYAAVLFVAVYGILLILLAATVYAGWSILVPASRHAAVLLMALVPGWILGIYFVKRCSAWAYDKAREDLPTLQRTVAVKLARRFMKQRIRRSLRG